MLFDENEDELVSRWECNELDAFCIWKGDMNIMYEIVTTEH